MDFLRDAAAAAPHRLALDDGERCWSYQELDRRVDEVARALVTSGVPRGRRVATLLPQGQAVVLAVHAVPRSGAVVAPLHPRLTPAELAAALQALEPAALLTTRGLAERARAALTGTDAALLLALEDLVASAGAEDLAPRQGIPDGAGAGLVEPPREWAVLWTSGTGGCARGVALSAENLRASAQGSCERLGLAPEDRWYLSLSPAHVGGLALITRAACARSTVVARGAFSAETFNALVDGGEVTHASLVPTMLLRALEERRDRRCPATLRCVLLGGARAPGDLVGRALRAGFPVALTYGLTEASSQVATAPPQLVRADSHTVGLPLPGVEVRVDGSGEILVRGPTVALGYVGSNEPMTDAGGWLHSGDLGELDGDGLLRVTGRRADRIVSGGVNVDPAEVEDVLRLHAGVCDVAVVGVPDPEWGELVAAAVVRRPGAVADASQLEALARTRLATAKVPRRFVFVDALPRNANGKVERSSVRGLLDGPPPPGPQRSPPSSPL